MEMQQSNHRRKPDWSNLPTEILQLLDRFLFKGQDLMNFRYVCKNWFHSTLISSFLPRTAISDVPKKVISSSILLLRPLNSPQLPPLMVLAVEPVKGVIKLFNPFTRIPLLNLPENIDLARFSSTRLSKAYHIVDEDDYEPDMFSARFIKVLVCYRWSVRHCSMLTLSDGGRLHELTPFKMYKADDKCSSVPYADDIVRFNGREHSLDKDGFLWLSKEWSYLGLYIVDCTFCGKVRRRKRLAVIESSPSERLLMIVPVNGEGLCLQFKVYELTDKGRSYVWSEVTSFGDADLILFVSRNSCFFVAASEFAGCQLRNCIVFSDDAFPRYSESKYKPGWNYEGKVGDNVAIYSVNGQGSSWSIPARGYPGFPAMLWSPPPWILHNALSPLQSPAQFQSDFDVEVERIQHSDSNKEDSQAEESESDSEGKESESEDVVFPNATQAQTTGFPAVNDGEHVNVEASHLEVSRAECSNAQTTHSVTRAYITSITQSNQSDNATVKFEGLEIRPSLLSTLQKVWSKYGNLIENIAIRNGDIVSRALESLATTIQILEDNSVGALTYSQADYLSSTLSDLRFMQFKVDWLVPYVEKALELHKIKPLLESRDKLGHCKAQISEKISKTLEELAALDKLADELDEDIASVSKVIPFFGNVDLDKPLGGVLS